MYMEAQNSIFLLTTGSIRENWDRLEKEQLLTLNNFNPAKRKREKSEKWSLKKLYKKIAIARSFASKDNIAIGEKSCSVVGSRTQVLQLLQRALPLPRHWLRFTCFILTRHLGESNFGNVEHETSPKPVLRAGTGKETKRPNKSHHVNKGKQQRDRRKLREKRRSTGVVHLASTGQLLSSSVLSGPFDWLFCWMSSSNETGSAVDGATYTGW